MKKGEQNKHKEEKCKLKKLSKSDRVENFNYCCERQKLKKSREEQAKESENNGEKMEKSSLNIQSFRNLLSSQNKNYKISPNNYHPTEVKLNGLNGSLDDSTNSCDIDDVYSIKLNKKDSANDDDCNQRNLTDVICGNLIKFVGSYNSSFCLTVLTPVACR